MYQSQYLNIVNLYLADKSFSNIIPNDFFDGLTSEKEKAERILNNSACKDFSCAVHEVTGWEVWEYGSEDTNWFHRVCKIPNSNLIIDGKGIRTENEMLSDCPQHTYAVDTDPEPFFLITADELSKLMIFAKYILKRDKEIYTRNTA